MNSYVFDDESYELEMYNPDDGNESLDDILESTRSENFFHRLHEQTLSQSDDEPDRLETDL